MDRKAKVFTLTSLGKDFLNEAKFVVDTYQKAMDRIEAIRIPTSNELKIGYTKFAYQLPGFFELIDDLSHLASEVFLEECTSQELVGKVRDFAVDIGVFHFPLHGTKGVKFCRITECDAVVLFPRQLGGFRENQSYNLILNEDETEKIYNEYLLKNFSTYTLFPVKKVSSQLAPQLALRGKGILIYPEPIAVALNVNNIFTLEKIRGKVGKDFGLFTITQNTPLKRVIDDIFIHCEGGNGCKLCLK